MIEIRDMTHSNVETRLLLNDNSTYRKNNRNVNSKIWRRKKLKEKKHRGRGSVDIKTMMNDKRGSFSRRIKYLNTNYNNKTNTITIIIIIDR